MLGLKREWDVAQRRIMLAVVVLILSLSHVVLSVLAVRLLAFLG